MVSKPASFTGKRSFDPVPTIRRAATQSVEVATTDPGSGASG